MNREEEQIAEELYTAIMDTSRKSDRSQQASDYKVGVSDLGYCSERTRRMLANEDPDDTDMLAAFIGTSLGEGVEKAAKRAWPDVFLQAEVTVTLKGDTGQYNLTGHPDMIRPHGLVLDGKTKRGLGVVERTGPTQQQQFQRHLYGYGAWLAGYFPEGMAVGDVKVGNVWLDRSGDDKRLHVQIEPLSTNVINDATTWLDDVVYAYLQGEEARKEPPRQVCESTCGFFATCRMFDTDVEGLITDPSHLAAIRMDREATDLAREARRLKEQAKAELQGVTGSDGQWMVRWVHVNETVVPEQTRSGYDRLNITKMK